MFRFPVLCIFLCLFSLASVSANTEIRNFEAIERQEVVIPQTSQWPTLHSGANEGQWSLKLTSVEMRLNTTSENSVIWEPTSYPHEMWTVLDVDHEKWKSYSKFTLRISWPASSPARFFVHIYTSESLPTQLQKYQYTSITDQNTDISEIKSIRRMYAHIRVVDETDISACPQSVVFRIILEPLIVGVLPISVQPTILALTLVTALATLAVPWINRYFERLARNAMEESAKASAEQRR